MTRRHPLRPERHEEEHARSARIKGDRIGHRPATLAGLLRWLQAGYALEAPNRLHDRDIADDGAPDQTPEAARYFATDRPRGSSEPWDTPRNPSWDRGDPEWTSSRRLDPDGFYATPMRRAISCVAGEERRKLLNGLACNVLTPTAVTDSMGIPSWCAGDVMYRALNLLWSVYTDRPIPQRSWVDKSDSQRAAEEAA